MNVSAFNNLISKKKNINYNIQDSKKNISVE